MKFQTCVKFAVPLGQLSGETVFGDFWLEVVQERADAPGVDPVAMGLSLHVSRLRARRADGAVLAMGPLDACLDELRALAEPEEAEPEEAEPSAPEGDE